MIAVASDHAGLELKKEIIKELELLGMSYRDYGCFDDSSCHYPEYAFKAAQAVVSGECDRGLLFCGTGVGVSIAANKVPGARCACCSDVYSASMARGHNNANLLALGGRVLGAGAALAIVRTFLETPFDLSNPRHKERLDMIHTFERRKLE